MSPAPRRRLLIPLALGIVYVGWGSTYLGIRVMVETVPPFLGAGARYGLAGLLMMGYLLSRGGRQRVRVTRRQLGSLAIVGTLLLTGGNGLVTVAERHLPAGLAALLFASVPLWIVLLRLAAGDRPPLIAVAGVLIGFAGVTVLLIPSHQPEGASIGAALTVIAGAVFFASGSFASGHLSTPAAAAVSTAYEMLFGGAVLGLLALISGEFAAFDLSHVSARSVEGFVFLVGPGSILTLSAYVWLLANAPLGLVATYAFINPAVAVGFGALLLGEAITGTVVLGTGIIVVAVALVVSRERVRETQAPQAAPGRELVEEVRL